MRPDLSLIDELARRPANVELARRARAVTSAFVRAGLLPGDRVLYAVRPTLDSVPLILGLAEAGGVLVPAPIGTGQSVFDAQMELVQPSWIVAESWLLAAARSTLGRRVIGWTGTHLPSLEHLRSARLVRIGPWLPGAGDALAMSPERSGAPTIPPTLAADDPMFIVFTSGTTDAPKAVVHCWRSIHATLDSVGAQLAIGRGDVMYARDLHLVLPALFAGARVIAPASSRFSAPRLLRDLRRHRVTHAFAVTADCQALLEYLETSGERLPDTLRMLLIGAAPVRTPFLRRLQDALPRGCDAWCVYGMTEMLPVATTTLADKLAYAGEGDLLGTLVPGVRAFVAPDGELIVSGPNLFTGYLGRPPATEHATGDLARLDGDRVILLGRKKDMIIRGQYNIYPELHEPVIERIAGVRRAAMVGVFDEAAADERVVLFVEPEPGASGEFERRLRRELRSGDTRIDDAAQPDLIVLATIPLSGRSRKVDKPALRRMARERLGA